MLVKFVQSKNARSPILVTLSGIVTLVKLVQELNADLPILVTPFSIITDLILELSQNGLSLSNE